MKITLEAAEVTGIVQAAMQQALASYVAGLGIAGPDGVSITVNEDGSAVIDTAAPTVAPVKAEPKPATPSVAKRQTRTTTVEQPKPVEQAPVVNGDTQLGGKAVATASATPEPEPTPAAEPPKRLFAKLAKPAEAAPAPAPESDAEMQARIDAEIADMNKARMTQADQIAPEPEEEDEPPFEVDQEPEAQPEEAAPPPPPARTSLFQNLRKPVNS